MELRSPDIGALGGFPFLGDTGEEYCSTRRLGMDWWTAEVELEPNHTLAWVVSDPDGCQSGNQNYHTRSIQGSYAVPMGYEVEEVK